MIADPLVRGALAVDPTVELFTASPPSCVTSFRAVALAYPERPALEHGGATVTYRELSQRAERISRALVSRDIGAGTVVGVWGQRSPDTIATILGILGARAVLVLFDRDSPAIRTGDQLNEAGCRLVVDVTGTCPDVPARRVRLTELLADPGEARVLPLPEVLPADDAYIFFTSGTTGRPKGVLGWHGAFAQYIRWEHESFGFGVDDIVAQIASFSFDAVLRDMFLALACGATLSLPPVEHPLEDPVATLGWLSRSGATILHSVPSVAASWLAAATENQAPHDLSRLRLLALAGEPLHGGLVRALRREFAEQHARVINLYGTTETTILKSCFEVPEQVDESMQPVGSGIDAAQLIVVNRRGVPCEAGEPGEVLIRSPFMTRGYVTDGRLSSTPFVPNPFRDEENDLVQRTGDIGVYDKSGVVTVAGRIDDQVKIRGIRLDPADIAAVLADHPSLQAAAVVNVGPAGEPRLVAYIVAEDDCRPAKDELRTFLGDRLAYAAVPSDFVFLAGLPLDLNGKLDRDALSEVLIIDDSAESGDELEPPRAGVEQAVAEAWEYVLGAGVTDRSRHVLELGGNSLSMVRILARVREMTGTEVALREFFAAPTVAGLAALLAGRAVSDHARAAELTGRCEGPLTSEQLGVWLAHQVSAAPSAYNMAGLFELPRSSAGWTAHDLDGALRAVARRHPALRTTVDAPAGLPRQFIAPDVPSTTLAVDLGAAGSAEQARDVCACFASDPFDLEHGPLLRGGLVTLADGGQWLCLVSHHLVCDGWSWQLLSNDLGALLGGRELAPLPPGPTMVDVALRWREPAEAERVERSLDFWLDTLRGAPRTESPAPDSQATGSGFGTHRVTISTTGTDGLACWGAAHGVTPYMGALGMFAATLSAVWGCRDLVIGTDDAGRDSSSLDQVVGHFVRTQAVRLQVNPDDSLELIVQRTREFLLTSHEHRQAPFTEIVRRLALNRSVGVTPVFGVVFRMPPGDEVAVAEHALEPVGWDGAFVTAKFEMTLVVREVADGLSCSFEYDERRYSAGSVARLAETFQILVNALLVDAKAPLTRVVPVPKVADRVPHAKDDGAEPLPGEFGAWVEAAATRRGSAVAVRSGSLAIDWTQLRDAVRAWDEVLPECAVIGVHGGSQPSFVPVLVAGLLRRRVVVPLDCRIPAVRLAGMASGAGVQIIVDLGAQEPLQIAGVLGLSADEVGRPAADTPQVDLDAADVPDDAAYVFFTSGTTGEPKAVLGRRSSLRAFVEWERSEFAFGPADRLAQQTSISFDAVLRDVLVPLSAQACIEMPTPDTLYDAEAHAQWLDRSMTTVLHTTPSRLATLVAAESGVSLRAVRLVCLSGEPLSGSLVQRFRTAFPECAAEIVNFYGPTETTMIKTWYPVPAAVNPGPLPIGSALPGTRVEVRDERGAVCGPGERGELVIVTLHATLGYLAAPLRPGELRVDPAAAITDEYATHDAARRDADGHVWVEGRLDGVLKVRGVRFHPSEIESVAAQVDGIAACHVELARRGVGEQIVLFWLAQHGASAEDVEPRLDQAMRASLPSPLQPTSYHVVGDLPTSVNGKVDGPALLARLNVAASAMPKPAEALPRTPTEAALADIWSELLDVKTIGLDDDFFALGGHSLLATIMISRVRSQLSPELTLRDVLAYATVRAVAGRIDERFAQAHVRAEETQQLHDQPEYLVMLSASPPGGASLFAVPALGGDASAFRALAEALSGIAGVAAFQTHAKLAGTKDVRQIAAGYAYEMIEAQPEGPYRLLAWSAGGVVAWEMAQQLLQEDEKVELFLLDAYAPGNAAFVDFNATREELVQSFRRDLGRSGVAAPDVESWATSTGSGDADIHPLDERFAIWAASAQAVGHYVPRSSGSVPRTVLIRGVDEVRPAGTDDSLGWVGLVGAQVEVVEVPGDHYGVLDPTVAEVIAQEIEARVR